jgi:hypothetical protein
LIAPLSETDLPIVGKFFSAYLNGQTQLVKLFHNQSSIDNATAMDLTISGLSIQADLDGIHAKLINQVNVLNFGIEFDRNDVNKVYVSGRLTVLFQLPSNINMTFKVLTSSIDFIMRFNDGPALGRIILHDLPVQHNQTTNELLMSFVKQELIVLNATAFEEFAANLVLTTNVTVGIEGLASALALIRIGNITLTNIPVNDTLHLVGYNQFDNGLLNINNTDIAGSISPDALALQVKTEITNPSVVNMIYGGQLLLDLCDMSNGTSLGTVNIDPFFLEPQGNTTIINAEGIFNITDQNIAVAKTFMSNMVSGIDNQVELRGTLDDNSTGTSIPLLSLAIAGLRIHTKVPGLTGEKILVRELLVKKLTAAEIAGITIGLVKHLQARIRVRNPFSTGMSIRGMNAKVDYGAKIDHDLQLGFVNDHTRMDIGPHQELISPYVTVTIAAKLSTLIKMIGPLLSGDAHLSLYGTIDVTIGDDFSLDEIPVTILNIPTQEEKIYDE